MPAHVYECDKSELEALKKFLAYDPYLDTDLIPPSSEDKPKTEEEKKAALEREQKVQENLKKLKESKYSDVIFSRQEYEIFDGANLGLQKEKSYLYVKANEEFLAKADELLKEKFKGVKRADKEAEQKVIGKAKEQEESANLGFGSIFG